MTFSFLSLNVVK